MALDPTKFTMITVSDTCSVWNVLSSRKLYQAAMNAKVNFCITAMVLYECLQKPRTSMTQEKAELINRLKSARQKGEFPVQECDLEDLSMLVAQAPKGLGSGELSCIATACRIRSIAFMTDERKARKFASEKLSLTVETTPKLYAWLHYYRHLCDGDHAAVIREHENYEARPLTKFLSEAYEEALRCRLMQ
jgi:predicted nucleic acid-binding protein